MKELFEKIEAREQRDELNLYITGYDEDTAPREDASPGAESPGDVQAAGDGDLQYAPEGGTPGLNPEDSPTR